MFSVTTVGPCSNTTIICELSKESKDRWLKKKPTEAERLLSNFLYDPENTSADASIRRRLKCINRLSNQQTFNLLLGPLVRKYNGVPFLIRDSSSFALDTEKTKGGQTMKRWAIVNVDINKFGKLAKKSLWGVRGHAKTSVMD